MLRNQTLATSMRESIEAATAPANQNAAAAVGQSLMMSMYETLFSKYNLSCAQVLVTESDMSDSETIAQVGDTTNELLQHGIVPIINENDAVTSRVEPVFAQDTREVQWDNDVLASRLAAELKADLLVILTDIDGSYTHVAGLDTGEGAQRWRVPPATMPPSHRELHSTLATCGLVAPSSV